MTWQPTAQTRAPRTPRISVDEEQIPDLFIGDTVRQMRSRSLSLNPSRIGPGFGIDHAMTLAGIDADDRLLAWRLT